MKSFAINQGVIKIDLRTLLLEDNKGERDKLFTYQKNNKFRYIEVDISVADSKKTVTVLIDTQVGGKQPAFLSTYKIREGSETAHAAFIGKFTNGPEKDQYMYLQWGPSARYFPKPSTTALELVRDYAVEKQVNYDELTNEVIWNEFFKLLEYNSKAADRLSTALKVLKIHKPDAMATLLDALFVPNADQALKMVEHKSFQVFLAAFMQQASAKEKLALRAKLIALLFMYFPKKPDLLVSYMDPNSAQVLRFIPSDMNSSFKEEFITRSLTLSSPVKVDPLRTALANGFITLEQIKTQLQKLESKSELATKVQSFVDLFTYIDDSKVTEMDFSMNIMLKIGLAMQSNPSLVFNHLVDIFKNLERNEQLNWSRYEQLLTMLCFIYGKKNQPLHIHLVPVMSAIWRLDFDKNSTPQLFKNNKEKEDFINQKCPELFNAITEHANANPDKKASEPNVQVNNDNNSSAPSAISQAPLDLYAVEYLTMLLLLVRPSNVGDAVDYIDKSIMALHQSVVDAKNSKTNLQEVDLDKEQIGILYRFGKLIGFVIENAPRSGPRSVGHILGRLQELQTRVMPSTMNPIEIIADIVVRLHNLAVQTKEYSKLTTLANLLWDFLGKEKITDNVDIGNSQNILGAALGKPQKPIPKPKVVQNESSEPTPKAGPNESSESTQQENQTDPLASISL